MKIERFAVTRDTSTASTVHIIGVGSGLGAPESGSGDGPAQLQLAGLDARLRDRALDIAWVTTLIPDAAPGEPLLSVFNRLRRKIADTVENSLRSGATPLVLGGDHSCAVGTWGGVASALDGGALGLIWIDAHLDSHTPDTTPSGRLHGMPLAALLGHNPGLTDGQPAVLLPEHVCVVGARSFETEEAALLAALGVRVYAMEEIRERGIDVVLREAAARARARTVAYGITVDLDAFDPQQAPGVTTPASGGLAVAPVAKVLAELCAAHPPVAVEIAEYNPHRDSDGITVGAIEQLASAALQGVKRSDDAAQLNRTYAARNYDPFPVVLTRGEGAHVWDDRGRRYLDMMASYSALNHGHAHPRIVEALAAQARTLAVASRAYLNDRLPVFLARLCELTHMDRALPANTGLEAVEAALKAARKWAYQVKRVPEDAAEIIACEGNFHGRSIAIIAMSSEPQYGAGFGPFPPGFKRVPYGDTEALDRAITPNTAAFLVEPIQGERGIVVPPDGYLAACARICAQRNVLLLVDEVQTGLGRTGKFLACEHEGVRPDGLMLGKALGGGVMPVSAFLAREDVMGVFRPGDHGSTFAGTPLAAAVGLAAIDVLLEEGLSERSAMLGAYFLERLRGIASPLVREVRGRGLMIGLEIDKRYFSARTVVERLLEEGILTNDTHESVVRLTPPLVVTHEQLDWALERIERVLRELEREIQRVPLHA